MFEFRPETFKQVFRAVKRLEVETTVRQLYTVNQSVNGSEESISKYISALDIWSDNPVESKPRLDKYRASLVGKQGRRK